MDIEAKTDKIADAVRGREWDKAKFLVAIRVAEALDETTSARDVKSLSLSLHPLIDECARGRIGMEDIETPLDRILKKAEDERAQIEQEKAEREKGGAPHGRTRTKPQQKRTAS